MPDNNAKIFDTKLSNNFRRRAYRRAFAADPSEIKQPDFLLAHTAKDLQTRLAVVSRYFNRALDLYSHTDLAARALAASGKITHINRIESLPELASKHFPTDICAADSLILPTAQTDLIISLLSLQNINDVPGLLIRIRQALKPDGLFLAALCGAGTLGELRETFLQAESEFYGGATPHVAPFADVREGGALLQRAGFALPVADSENIIVRYDNLFALMRDLRAMGSQNALLSRARHPFSRRFFLRAAEIYAERFSDSDKRIRASFSILWLSGWAPHNAQQKPALRGSAKMSLATELKKY